MQLQEFIHHIEVGAGARLIKVAAAFLAFLALACVYDVLDWQNFSSEEAMETAQLARNISQGKGYVTQSVRPLSIYLLQKMGPPGQTGNVFQKPIPDVSTPPAYPVALAAAMTVLPLHFNDAQWWSYQPERWIAGFNQLIFLVALVLLYRVAIRLFDKRVAWLSVILFGGTNLFWRFTLSGTSTCWVMMVLLAMVWCLVRIEEHGRASTAATATALGMAFAAGLLLGLGGLSRYSFALLIFPALLYVASVAPRSRGGLCSALAIGFLVVMVPWIVRNVILTGLPFGDRTLAIMQGTDPFPGDTLERSFSPQAGMARVSFLDVVDKFLANGRELWRDGLPRLGGNWITAFFFVGLLMPFRSHARGRMRWFIAGSFVILFFAQVLGQTHVSSESIEVNTENLLVLLVPLIIVYGAALFYTLLDQWDWASADLRSIVSTIVVVLLCAPLIMTLLISRPPPMNSPYSPLRVQQTARLFRTNELLTSDIPSGVAWYGNRACAWLPLDDDRDYYILNSLRPVKGLYLTQRTTDLPLLSGMILAPKSWGYFLYQCQAKGEVPDKFPLTKSPLGFLPYQLLLSDQARWRAER